MSGSQSSNEEDEISALEYARQNGLACNHLAQPRPLSALASLAQSIDDGITDDSHLPQFKFLDYSTDERLPISKGAAQLLSWVSTTEKVDSVNAIALSMGKRGTRPRRLELPLLRSDHETDCKHFAKREAFEIQLKDVMLPSEFVDDEKDEGLVFPSRIWEKEAEIMEELKKERILVTKQGFMYLQDAVADKWDEIEEKAMWTSLREYKKSKTLEPVTPPLSPMSPPPQLYEPTSSDPAFQLPLLSDPPSLTEEDLGSIEKKIWEQDVPTPIRVRRAARSEISPDASTGDEATKLGDIYSPLTYLDRETTPPVTDERKKKQNLKIEETLTPPDPSPAPKMVKFSDFIEEMVFPQASPPLEEDLDHFFEDAFGDAGERAMRMIEQETLIAADTTARVNVPIMDFSTPDPPWKGFDKQGSASKLLVKQKAFIVETLGRELLKWPGSKQGELKLQWNPFPHALAKNNYEEDFPQDDNTWKSIVFDEEDAQLSRDVTWKPPGLRILKCDDDDDDEIEPGEFQKKFLPDLSYLVKKRKMEIDARGSEEPVIARPNSSAARIPRKNTPRQNDFVTAAEMLKSGKPNSQDMGLGLLGDTFSTESALDNYLEMRGKKKQKLVESSYFGTTSRNNVQVSRPTSGPGSMIQLPIRNSPLSKADPLPIPSIQPPAVPPNLIVSIELIKQRALIKQLETQLPGIKLIERDFSAHNSTVWMPNSVTRSPVASSLASEADIIVSPFTGIVITTLQKIKQKPLPGQKVKAAIRDRMEKVSMRYERVIVLVSEGRSDESSGGLDEGGCQALTDFVGFTIGLDSSVMVHVVGGGEETLSKWLVSAIVQHSVAGACELLEDETHWELFLRRAGMNAYAAQAILVELKAPEGVDATSPSKAGHFGLVAFVEMDMEQRIARFARLCGRKLLERVSACIDERWE